MASLVKKRVKGKSYYYLVWSARVNGKPRTIRQVYLGSAQEVASRLTDQVEPARAAANSYSVSREFGASAALFGLSQRLGLSDIIDAHVTPKRRGALSVGQYLTMAAINRCIAPASKRSLGEWHRNSFLSTLMPARRKDIEGQRFWDAMNQVTEDNIKNIEASLLKRVQELFQIDLRRVTFDATNFFTFIKTTSKCELPQRGHNKAKRDDLRQVSLALLAALDFGVPLFHACYAGNVADSKAFAAELDPMLERLKELGVAVTEVTLVFDKGNNSEENFRHLDGTNCHYVGSLPPSQHKDLMAVPLSSFV
ncbi:MAG: IS1634 family transposase [Terracidiphilus sp.]